MDFADCPEFPEGYFGETGTDSNGKQFTRTSASMVTDEESLVDYLKTAEEHMNDEVKKIQDSIAPLGLSPVEEIGAVVSQFSRLRPCWRQEPWTSGQIYFYLIRFTDKMSGVYNGLNAEFEDSTLLLYDGCVDYGATVFDMLSQEGVTEGFLRYYWSDPTKPDDVVVDDSGNPIRGLSTGTSVKLGYFKETTSLIPGSLFVLGSGIYPDEEYYVPEGGMCQGIPDDLSLFAREYLDEFPNFTDFMGPEQPESPEQPEQPESPQKDDDGCAIASVDGGNLKAAGLSFLLIAAVMFFGVFGKRCFGRKV